MEKISTNYVMFMLRLKKEKLKEYTKHCPTSSGIYVFNSLKDYYNYFLENGVEIIDEKLFNIPIYLTLKNGDILASKHWCDKIITLLKEYNKETIKKYLMK